MERISTLVIGILMLVLSKWVINLHMKMFKAGAKNIYKTDFNKHPKLLKFYRIFFSIVWIGLGLFFTIISFF